MKNETISAYTISNEYPRLYITLTRLHPELLPYLPQFLEKMEKFRKEPVQTPSEETSYMMDKLTIPEQKIFLLWLFLGYKTCNFEEIAEKPKIGFIGKKNEEFSKILIVFRLLKELNWITL